MAYDHMDVDPKGLSEERRKLDEEMARLEGLNMWKVGYTIDGVAYEATIPDGSTPYSGYVGMDKKAFKAHIAQEHPGTNMKDVKVTYAIEDDRILADFF